jgi:hypothetical protein
MSDHDSYSDSRSVWPLMALGPHPRKIWAPVHVWLRKFGKNRRVTSTSTASQLSLTSGPEFSISSLSPRETIGCARLRTQRGLLKNNLSGATSAFGDCGSSLTPNAHTDHWIDSPPGRIQRLAQFSLLSRSLPSTSAKPRGSSVSAWRNSTTSVKRHRAPRFNCSPRLGRLVDSVWK